MKRREAFMGQRNPMLMIRAKSVQEEQVTEPQEKPCCIVNFNDVADGAEILRQIAHQVFPGPASAVAGVALLMAACSAEGALPDEKSPDNRLEECCIALRAAFERIPNMLAMTEEQGQA